MARRPSSYYGSSFGERGRDNRTTTALGSLRTKNSVYADLSDRAQRAAGINSDDTPPPPASAAPSPDDFNRMVDIGSVKARSDKAKASLSGVPSFMATAMLGIGEFTRNQIVKQLQAGGQAIRDKYGNVVGVVHDGPFEGSKVYTGRRIAGYTGEFANLVAEQESDEEPQGQPPAGRGAGPITEPAPNAPKSEDVNADLPDLPDAPTGPGTGDASDEAKKKSKMGRESTTATGPGGLLTPARTRRRSLMAGLIQ